MPAVSRRALQSAALTRSVQHTSNTAAMVVSHIVVLCCKVVKCITTCFGALQLAVLRRNVIKHGGSGGVAPTKAPERRPTLARAACDTDSSALFLNQRTVTLLCIGPGRSAYGKQYRIVLDSTEYKWQRVQIVLFAFGASHRSARICRR
jgi:hypothetical protein